MTTYGYIDDDGDRLKLHASVVPGHFMIETACEEDYASVRVRNEEAASLMLAIARAAGWKTNSETQDWIEPGSTKDWQADVVAALLGAIRKAADDKVKAEAEAEELEHAAHLLAAYLPALTLADARCQVQGDEGVRRTWLTVVRAARAQFAPNTLPF